jgi:hypothetical protein
MSRVAALDSQVILLKWMAGTVTGLAFMCFVLLLMLASLIR